MKNLHSTAITRLPRQLECRETAAGVGSRPLEVNVVFTDPQATAAALKSAHSLARELGACVRLRAAIVVPMVLPLDQPPVSVRFIEQLLGDLICQTDQDTFQPTVHLYICRDWVETLLQVLRPHSLVVIGGRKRRWPTAPSRTAGALRAKGHMVVFVETRNKKDNCAGYPR
jgi:hypothetical protein